MSITVTPDAARGPGHALIRVPGAASVTNPGFRISRPPDWPEPNLGPSGWQGSETTLVPDETRPDGADLLLAVGPSVCGRLEEGTYYFALPAAGLNGAVTWPEIEEVHGGTEAYFAAKQAKPPPGPALGGTTPVKPPEPVEPVLPPPLPPGSPPPVPVPPPVRRSALPLVLGALLLLAAAGAAYWWWPRPAPTPPVPPQNETAPSTPAQRPEPAPTPPPPPPAADLDTMSVQNLVARNDPAAMLDQARKRLASKPGDSQLLLEASGEDRHYGPALTLLAQLYDPGKPRQGGIGADARQAAKYYRDAARNGDASGAADREALHGSLIARRDAGDLNAKLIEQDFWP